MTILETKTENINYYDDFLNNRESKFYEKIRSFLLPGGGIFLLFTGCTGRVQPVNNEIPVDDPPASVIVDGVMYHQWRGDDLRMEIAEENILGYVASCVGVIDFPVQEGESNRIDVGTPYARWPEADDPDGLAVYDRDEDSRTLLIPCARWHYSPSAADNG